MSDVERDRTLALAGVLQSAYLADQLACTGHAPAEEFSALLNSLFIFDPQTTPEVFSGAAGVHLGLKTMDRLLTAGLTSQPVVLSYASQLMKLQAKLLQNKELFSQLQYELKQESQRGAHGDAALARRCRAIDTIYQQTVSNLDFRIRLRGNPERLAQLAVVARIRVSLLAGLRCCLLWRQLGGHVVQLLWKRRLHAGVRACLRQLGAAAG